MYASLRYERGNYNGGHADYYVTVDDASFRLLFCVSLNKLGIDVRNGIFHEFIM